MGTTPAGTTTPTSERLPIDAGWTPFVPDPAKTAAENLAAKEAHDARVPEGHDPNVKLDPKPGYQPPNAPKPADPSQQPTAQTPPLMLTDLVAPEGFNIDPAMGTELITMLNKHAGDAKGLANELIQLQVKALAQDEEARSRGWDETQTKWKQQSEADPEIGGAKYQATTAAATDIVARFGGAPMQEALELTGMGNHPEFLRFITKIAPFLTEAAPVSPSAPTTAGPQYTPTNLYPDMGRK